MYCGGSHLELLDVNYYTFSSKKKPLILHEFFLAETHVTGAYQVRKAIFIDNWKIYQQKKIQIS
jgi:hypothetical protein